MRNIIYVLRKYPIVSYGIFILVVNQVFDAFRFAYDTGGIITILFFLLPILGLPYWLSQETLFSSNGGRGFPGLEIYATLLGLIIFVLLEFIYQFLRAKFRNKNSSDLGNNSA